MRIVNVHEAKTHFSALLVDVEAGETITIARAGRPVAYLSAAKTPQPRELGIDEGKPFWIAEDFDEVIPPGFEPYVARE